MIFWACFRFAGDYFRFEPIYLIEAIEALNEYPVSYKFRFIGVFDVSEANRIPKPRISGLLYEERPAGVVKNSRCSLRRMRYAYCEDCAKAQNEERATLVEYQKTGSRGEPVLIKTVQSD